MLTGTEFETRHDHKASKLIEKVSGNLDKQHTHKQQAKLSSCFEVEIRQVISSLSNKHRHTNTHSHIYSKETP